MEVIQTWNSHLTMKLNDKIISLWFNQILLAHSYKKGFSSTHFKEKDSVLFWVESEFSAKFILTYEELVVIYCWRQGGALVSVPGSVPRLGMKPFCVGIVCSPRYRWVVFTGWEKTAEKHRTVKNSQPHWYWTFIINTLFTNLTRPGWIAAVLSYMKHAVFIQPITLLWVRT